MPYVQNQNRCGEQEALRFELMCEPKIVSGFLKNQLHKMAKPINDATLLAPVAMC